ncbi:MAG: hypothetical protein H7333_02240 [Bdellovibrionales bacterium]|nr:hypothetical protein [Oligoflexia bacterium]
MENSFYEVRPYLFLMIALYALIYANTFVGYACAAILVFSAAFVIRSRYLYRVQRTN